MTEARSPSLHGTLVMCYDFLVGKLTRKLGSRDLAEEALHDTYVKLARIGPDRDVRDPIGYLLRSAANSAQDRRVVELRRATGPDEHSILAAVDDAPDPARIAEARSEWQMLETALDALPQRRRDIFFAAWIEEVPHESIAARYGVSVRTIQIEIKRALEHCAQALGRI